MPLRYFDYLLEEPVRAASQAFRSEGA